MNYCRDLDMSQWCVDNRAGAEYDLIAVNNHMGEYGSGHCKYCIRLLQMSYHHTSQ